MVLKKKSELKLCLDLLDGKSRKQYVLAIIAQSLLGFLDLLGVGLLGVIGALTVRGVQSKEPGDRVQRLLDFLHLSNFSFQGQIAILGLLSIMSLILKTLLSMKINRSVLAFLGKISSGVANTLISKGLNRKTTFLEAQGSQSLQWAYGVGVSTLSIGVLGSVATIVSDFSMLIIIFTGVLVLDPFTALTSTFIFLFSGSLLYFFLRGKTSDLSRKIANNTIDSHSLFLQVFSSFREIYIKNKQFYYVNKLGKLRSEIETLAAKQAFLPYTSKYVLEISLIVGTFIISALVFLKDDSSSAIASLALFLGAGSRIGPGLLRIQQSLLTIKAGLAFASPTINLIKELKDTESVVESRTLDKEDLINLDLRIKVEGLSFRYNNSNTDALKDIDFSIEAGETIAVVGPSGAGKTSLIDLILGIHSPTAGKITISNMRPEVFVSSYPGIIGYVPQKISIFSATLRENIALGINSEEIVDADVNEALLKVGLVEYVESLPLGLETKLLDSGSNLSGGQIQRLGIARALFSNPKILVLDEATSALDGISEAQIAKTISGLKGSATVIMIAHRLSSVRNANKVLYVENGKLLAIGSFEEIREKIPAFNDQAKLMGL
jgi:ABC-type multidrug transport system fused ATPase/permease subunit